VRISTSLIRDVIEYAKQRRSPKMSWYRDAADGPYGAETCMKGVGREVKGGADVASITEDVVAAGGAGAWRPDAIGPEKRAPADLVKSGAKEAALGLGTVSLLGRWARNAGSQAGPAWRMR
jgi:hypothetical protein